MSYRRMPERDTALRQTNDRYARDREYAATVAELMYVTGVLACVISIGLMLIAIAQAVL